ncbi:MAG TPA: macro domain-containing protein [Pseudonocardiaceae bacterium]|jgi:O-acetyl-ADP-ribose deacetylase (regulator of RNase III)|nr:macro domain-containing protein [Pseudonocardiaceae bacterium]
MLVVVTVDSPDTATTGARWPRVVLCSIAEPMAAQWQAVAAGRANVDVHRGSVLDVAADAAVSPANSYGLMRGGIDATYSDAWPGIEQRVRGAILALHGGELPVGEAVIVPTGADPTPGPAWLISAPTMREPSTVLPADTVHPYLAARAVFRLWRNGVLEDGRPVRSAVRSIAMPGLGTGVGGVPPEACAHQVAAAWDEVFGQ